MYASSGPLELRNSTTLHMQIYTETQTCKNTLKAIYWQYLKQV